MLSAQRQSPGKFDTRSEQGIFTGYSTECKAYRVYLSKLRKIVVSRDVKFMSEFGFKHEYKEIFENEDCNNKMNFEMDKQNNTESDYEVIEEKREEPKRARKRGATVSWEELVEPPKRGRGHPRLLRSGSVGRPRKIYVHADEVIDNNNKIENEPNFSEDDDVFTANLTVTHDPVTWRQAKETIDADAWRIALEDEYLAHIRNGTWEIVPRPRDRKVIGSRFVFCTKNTGNTEKKKVRFVAKGCSQRPGEDFQETYSPVVKSTSVRLLAALAAEYNLEIHHMDVVTAYLNGELEEEVYMEVPEQLSEVLDQIKSNKSVGTGNGIIKEQIVRETANRWYSALNAKNDRVCLLKKSLYGLSQSGLQWYKKLINKLRNLGFSVMPQDPCMFLAQKTDNVMLIAIYVDDILIATNDKKWLSEVKHAFSESFEMKDLGIAKYCLGIEFSRDEESRVFLKQRNYIENVLERFGMKDCKPVSTPIESSCKLSKPQHANDKTMNQYPYQSLISALMFLAVSTRPDIAYSINFLSQFNNNYNVDHWKAAKRVLRYLKGTAECGLEYERTGLSLFGVVDADWSANLLDRRSYSGFAFILAGAPISWEARKQRAVALSSTEAEYMALSEATKEALYLSSILEFVGVMSDSSVKLFNDNQGAIKLAQQNK